MGAFGRWREKVKAVGPGAFKATKTARVDAMWKEAGDFCHKLQQVEKNIVNMQSATSGLLNMTEHILTSALPHVYKVEEPGSVNSKAIPIVPAENLSTGPLTSAPPVNPADPVNPEYPAEQQLNPFMAQQHQQPVAEALTQSGRRGPRIKLQDLTVISKQSEEKLQSDVLTPIGAWMKELQAWKPQIKHLQKARLEFDAERRNFNKLEMQRVRQQQAKDMVEPDLQAKLNAHQNALDEKRNIFQATEQQVFDGLAKIIEDAKALHILLAAALRIQEETFKSCLTY
jgi:hypothetical protein